MDNNTQSNSITTISRGEAVGSNIANINNNFTNIDARLVAVEQELSDLETLLSNI